MAEQCARAEALIKSRSNVFSRSEYEIGRTCVIPHCINTGDNTPHFEQLRHHRTTQLLLIDEHVEHMPQHDIIKPDVSPWCSNVVMVQNGTAPCNFVSTIAKLTCLLKRTSFICPKSVPVWKHSTAVNTLVVATSIGILATRNQ